MKLRILKPTLILSIIASFAFVAQADTERRKRPAISPDRIINMAYNLADRLDEEAHLLSNDELKKIRKNLRNIRSTMNGDDVVKPKVTEHKANCITIKNKNYSNEIRKNIGYFNGTIESILKTCHEVKSATVGTTTSTGIALNNLTVKVIGNAKVTVNCKTIKNKNYNNEKKYSIGDIASSTLKEALSTCHKIKAQTIGTTTSTGIEVTGIKFEYNDTAKLKANCVVIKDKGYSSEKRLIVGEVIGTTIKDLSNLCNSVKANTIGTTSNTGIDLINISSL